MYLECDRRRPSRLLWPTPICDVWRNRSYPDRHCHYTAKRYVQKHQQLASWLPLPQRGSLLVVYAWILPPLSLRFPPTTHSGLLTTIRIRSRGGSGILRMGGAARRSVVSHHDAVASWCRGRELQPRRRRLISLTVPPETTPGRLLPQHAYRHLRVRIRSDSKATTTPSLAGTPVFAPSGRRTSAPADLNRSWAWNEPAV